MSRDSWTNWITKHNPYRRLQRGTAWRLYELVVALEDLCWKKESSSNGGPAGPTATQLTHHGITLTEIAEAANLTVKQVRLLVGSANDEPPWLRIVRAALWRHNAERVRAATDEASPSGVLLTRVLAPRCDAVMVVAADGSEVRTIDCEMEVDYGSAVRALIERCGEGDPPAVFDLSSMLSVGAHPLLGSSLPRFAFTVDPAGLCPQAAHLDPRVHGRSRHPSVQSVLDSAHRGTGFVELGRTTKTVDVLSNWRAPDGPVAFVARVEMPGDPRTFTGSVVREHVVRQARRLALLRSEPPAGDDLVLRHFHLRSAGSAAAHLTILLAALRAARS